MKRRSFVAGSAALGVSTLTADAMNHIDAIEDSREVYEIRTYELSFGGDRGSLISYLQDVVIAACLQSGAQHSMILKEVGDAEPHKIWVFIAYPDMATYQKCLEALSSEHFISASQDHASAGKTFNRYVSSLSKAFGGMPQMRTSETDKALLELRLYEGYNDDAVRRKVMMFDDEELALFDKMDMGSVFFGHMIIGPYMPCLVYMLAYNDRQDRDEAWARFINSEEWDQMKVKPKYADTVSNIRKIFLEKL